MQAQTPEAVGTGVGFIGILTVFLIVPLNGVNHANAHFGNQVINGV